MTNHNSLSGILYYITAFSTAIAILIAAYFTLMSILGAVNALPNKMRISIEVPVRLQNINNYYKAKAVKNDFEAVRIEVEDARLKAIPTDGRMSQFLGYLIAAIYTSFFGLILFQLLKVLETFKNNQPFTQKNVSNVRRIGWLTLSLVLFELVIHFWAKILYQDSFSVSGAIITDTSIWEEIEYIALFLGLVILALSEVFKKGATLRKMRILPFKKSTVSVSQE